MIVRFQPGKSSISLEGAGRLMTCREFDSVEEWDDRYRYELIHGVLVVSSLPLPSETGPNQALGVWLVNYQEQHAQGHHLDATLPEQLVHLESGRRRADRLIWTGLGRMPNVERDLPSIVIEFVSESKRDWRRDYDEKKHEYMAMGIGEYWIIDRFRRAMTVVRLQADGFSEDVYPEKATYKTPLLPGFKLSLKKLFAIADRWTQAT
jgi:Uma2 family endonuclease